MTQSAEHMTSTQVIILRFMGSSPVEGSVLTAQSLEPTSDSVSLSPFASPLLMFSRSLKNKHKYIQTYIHTYNKSKSWYAWVAQSLEC